MADEGSATPVAAAPAAQPAGTEKKTATVGDSRSDDPPAESVASKDDEPKATPAEEKPAEPESKPDTIMEDVDTAKPTEDSAEKPADSDVEMKDEPDATTAPAADDAAGKEEPEAAASAPADNAAPVATPKNKTPARRKSTAGAESVKGKKLNKKASKAQITHLDAKPGDHYFIKLKGFPQWPCIICDEDMLPTALIKTRPVSAARADGTYREDYADGGKRAVDRSFPIMYLATNEFGWVSNKDLIDLDPEKVLDQVNAKMRKDLVLAHELAEQHNDLDYYKGVLQQFQEELLEKQQAAEAKAAAAAAAKTSKKKSKAVAVDDDLEMEDVDDEVPPASTKKDKKRKNPEDAETPQRSESVKKPKIKLTNNHTPKSNGATPSKAAKSGGEAKATKKTKKPAAKEESVERVQTPKEPEMSAEDRFERKKKEVLFLRHKLQKGLLTRDQQPKEEEMKMMSDYLTKLEGFPDLETEIIRLTKINKVLKAILKLDNIPKEEEFQFKPRSQALLTEWNKTLAADEPAPTSAGPEETNGVNGHKKAEVKKEEVKSSVNGVKKADTEESEAVKTESPKSEAPKTESKSEVKPEDNETDETKKAKESPAEESKTVAKKEEAPSTEEENKMEEDTKGPSAVEAEA